MSRFSFFHEWYKQDRNEEGQSLVIIAFVLVGILAFVGIAVDVGFVFARSSQLQSAVDAAALAGVTELITSQDAADTKAGQFLSANRIPIIGDADSTVTFASARGTSPLGATEYRVTVTWPVELFFLRVLGLRDVELTRSATAATFFLTDIYASRRVEEGTVGTSTQGIFGPSICTSFGDPFSPWSSPFAPGPYTYRYRILIPPDYGHEVVRVELFDPDSVNAETNSALVSHTLNAQSAPGNLPPQANKTCSDSAAQRKNPCVLQTDELALTNTAPYSETYQLDHVNPFWFVRVDENRGAGSPPGNNTCGEPGSYNTGFNTQTLYQLYYFQQSEDGNPVRVDLASYTGNTGDARDTNGFHNTDLHWVSPGGTPAANGPAVPVDPGSEKTFELNITNDLDGILVDQGSGSRYVYMDVTAISGSSENAFEIWAGPNDYVATVPSEVNARNVFVRDNPGAHNSQGVAVFALTNLPMNAVYGNNPNRPSEVDRPVDIPLIYVGPEYAGTSILVSLFDSDSGARAPVVFYFDSLGFTPSNTDPKRYNQANTDWAMSFGVAGQPDPDGQSRNCIPGGCDNLWVEPAYSILVPGAVDDCDWARVAGMSDPPLEADWVYRRDNCTPFYGGRLMARYIGGEADTYGWQIQLTGLPYLVD